MTRSLVMAAILATLIGAPAAVACEKCVPQGQKDPNGGGPYSSAICWTIASGSWSYCWASGSTCSTGDPENACPLPGSGGQCAESGGIIVCVENPEMMTDPAGRCRGTDVQGRCTTRPALTMSFLQ